MKQVWFVQLLGEAGKMATVVNPEHVVMFTEDESGESVRMTLAINQAIHVVGSLDEVAKALRGDDINAP